MISRRSFVAVARLSLLWLPQTGWTLCPVTKRRIGLLSAFPRATVDAFLGELRPELLEYPVGTLRLPDAGEDAD